MPDRLRALLLDMDGTIVDVPYDWPRVRRDLGVGDTSILSHLEGLRGPARKAGWDYLEALEAEATERAVLKRGVKAWLADVRRRGVRTALITNNSRRNLDSLLGRFGLAFDFVLSRDSGLWKPSAEPLRAAMRALGVPSEACAAIGDSLLDVHAALAAGVAGIYILTRNPSRFEGLPVRCVPTIAGLRRILAPRLPDPRLQGRISAGGRFRIE